MMRTREWGEPGLTAASSGTTFAPRELTIITLLIFIAGLLVLLVTLPSYDHFHRDENSWIPVSKITFRTYFVDRDFRSEVWEKSYNTWGSPNPQVGKFIMGLSLYLHGFDDFDGMVKWQGDKGLQWHRDEGLLVDMEEVYAARLPVVVFTAGTVALVGLLEMLVTQMLYRRRPLTLYGGLLAAVLLLWHPLTVENGRRAMIDMPALFFATLGFALTVAAVVRVMEARPRAGVLYGFGGAAALGLAVATKLNAVLLLAVALATMGAAYLASRRRGTPVPHRERTFLILVGLYLLLPPFIFLASNPFLWSRQIVDRLDSMYRFSQEIADRRPNWPQFALYSVAEKTRAFVEITLPVLFERTATIAAGAALFLLGAAVLALQAAARWRARRPVQAVVLVALLLWAGIVSLGVLLWTPLAWTRYYLPALPAAVLVMTLGMVSGVWLLGTWRRPARPPRTVEGE